MILPSCRTSSASVQVVANTSSAVVVVPSRRVTGAASAEGVDSVQSGRVLRRSAGICCDGMISRMWRNAQRRLGPSCQVASVTHDCAVGGNPVIRSPTAPFGSAVAPADSVVSPAPSVVSPAESVVAPLESVAGTSAISMQARYRKGPRSNLDTAPDAPDGLGRDEAVARRNMTTRSHRGNGAGSDTETSRVRDQMRGAAERRTWFKAPGRRGDGHHQRGSTVAVAGLGAWGAAHRSLPHNKLVRRAEVARELAVVSE